MVCIFVIAQIWKMVGCASLHPPYIFVIAQIWKMVGCASLHPPYVFATAQVSLHFFFVKGKT